MSISFNEVPANVRVPGVYIEIDNSLANSAEDLQRVLIVGAKGSDGDTAENTVVLTVNPDAAAKRFGIDSQIHKMVTAFYEQNISLPIYAVSVLTNDVATALASTGADQYHHIVCAFNDETNVRALGDFLQARYHALQQIPGLAYIAKKATHSALVAYGELFNNPFISVMSVNGLGDAANNDLTEAQLASAWAGQIAGSLAIDPCRPLKTLPLNKVYSKAPIDWDYSERNLLLYSGIGTYNTNNAKQVFIERPITTYKENAAGTADDSYLDITVPATAMYFRQKQRSRILSKYPRSKLAKDGTKFAPGQAVVTPAIIKGELLALYRELELKAIVQDFDGYKDSLIVELDADNKSRINILDSPQFVNGMLIYAGKVQFRK
ncbi:phage tail sheath subtilisin-like domain-containing protein [Psychromonas hadalis]|uniref:phage tail sheath subtilisin-like domain-containing protein n=1 Tax=Psychromonas hadalis TaxID=211669 RepID=UPI0003B6E3AF|nr:phage tail sheath subtilisin-like domain-containing protein [Psychromonas hadalis]